MSDRSNRFATFADDFAALYRYDFITHLCTALLAAGILLLVIVQRNIPQERTLKDVTLKFEIAKSGLATALWFWLMMDAAFGPQDHYTYYDRATRVQTAAFASLLLLLVPTRLSS